VKVLVRGLLAVCVAGVLIAFMELALRALDSRPSTPAAAGAAGHYVNDIPTADGVRREWFDLTPDRLVRPPLTPELAAVAQQTATSEIFKQWNTRVIQERVCGGNSFFDKFPHFAFSFVPDDGSRHPPYRFLRDVTTPYGLVTNRFGFRGHEISPDKPPRVVRIAFVGASTTVGSHSEPFSFPEFVERWLNRWADETAAGVRFEVVNAGREGIASADIASIVAHELVPLEPDIIVYHEGANEFTPQQMIEPAGEPIVVPSQLRPRTPVPGTQWSAVMRHVDVMVRRFGFGPGSEPSKPRHRLRWPATVSELHPNPDAPDLPVHLSEIVRNLDGINRSARSIGATVVVTSFMWMVKDGLIVDPVDRAYYLDMVNRQYWPVSYAEMRRVADFQNRVFHAYADSRAMPFVDVAAQYPLDIALFTDGVHTTEEGDRLRAWLMFQGLMPIIRHKLMIGELPVPDRAPFTPPAVPAKLPRTPLVCTDYSTQVLIDGALSLQALQAAADATVSGDAVKHVVTSGARYSYAAEAPFAETARLAKAGVVRIRARVTSGIVSISVLRKDRSAFVATSTLEAGHESIDVFIPVPVLADAGAFLISNASGTPGERSIVDIEDVAVLTSPSAE
jgi:hypothetical protein